MSPRTGILIFSPTNTTSRICCAVSVGMGSSNPKTTDVTNPKRRKHVLSDPASALSDADHLIVGAPVYFGKLPAQFSEVLSRLSATGIAATAIVVYGNRDYGIALRDMVRVLSTNGFNVSGAGAFIGQHSYSDVISVAVGRPDTSDLEIARDFGSKVGRATGGLSEDQIPVQQDIFTRTNIYLPLKPVFSKEDCTKCGECEMACPTGILTDTGTYIDNRAERRCIGCMACVQACTSGGRVNTPDVFSGTTVRFILRNAAVERNEPLTLIA